MPSSSNGRRDKDKRRPAPIVSLGKIIGYKVASLGVVDRMTNLLNDLVSRKQWNEDFRSERGPVEPSNVQTSKSKVTHRTKSKSSRNSYSLSNTDMDQDVNVNASLRQELARQRLAAVKTGRHGVRATQHSRIGKRGNSYGPRNLPRLRSKIAQQCPWKVETSKKLSKLPKRRPVYKPNDCIACSSHQIKEGKDETRRRSEAHKSKEQKLLAKAQEQQNKQVEEQHGKLLKSARKEWPMLKKLLEENEKSVGRLGETALGQTYDDKKRRYNEGETERSKNGVNKEYHWKSAVEQEDDRLATNKSFPNKNKERRKSLVDSLSSKKGPPEVDTLKSSPKRKQSTPRSWASVAKGATHSEDSHAKMPSPTAGTDEEGYKSLVDFPSLEESKGKKLTKNAHRDNRHQANVIFKQSGTLRGAPAMHKQFYTGDKSERQMKKGRNRQSKLRARLMNKKDHAEQASTSSPATTKHKSSVDSWYTIDNIQDVVLQPVGMAVPLHGMDNDTAKGPARTTLCVAKTTARSLGKDKVADIGDPGSLHDSNDLENKTGARQTIPFSDCAMAVDMISPNRVVSLFSQPSQPRPPAIV